MISHTFHQHILHFKESYYRIDIIPFHSPVEIVVWERIDRSQSADDDATLRGNHANHDAQAQ